jgi:hypothetical protein
MSSLPSVFSDADFRTDESEPLSERFVIVTAYNPDGLQADPENNAGAGARLRAELSAGGHRTLRITGGSRDRTHLERGWGIVTTDPNTRGATLARRYRKLTFIWICAGEVWMVDTARSTRY